MAAKAGAARLAYRGLDVALATALMVSGRIGVCTLARLN